MFRAKEGSILAPPSDEVVESFEKYYNVILPIEYREFLKKYNGVVPETNIFSTNNYDYVVERFLCLLNNNDRDELQDINWSELRVVLTDLDARLIDDENLVGMNIIPIAALFAGDFVCLDFRASVDAPTVCIWFHEESDEFSPVVQQISVSFKEFLVKLHN